MIKTPSTTMIGGAGMWTPGCTVIGGQQTITQLIKSLFADGTQGLYLNAQDAASISDLSSIKDLSGRNNHAAQANSTSRATIVTDPSGYKSLKFDGIDDGYVTPSINFSNTDKVTVIAAVRKLSDAAQGVIAELSSNSAVSVGSFKLSASYSNATSFGGTLGGATARNFFAAGYPAPTSAVLTTKFNISTAIIAEAAKLRINASDVIPSGDGAWNKTTSFGSYPLYIGRRGGTSLPFNGQIYALLVIGKILDDVTTQRIEKEFSKYVGVTL